MENNQSINNNQIREYNVDLLKTFATICMIICHVVYMLGVHKEGYHDSFWYFFADAILGSYLAVAHAFMFAMGFGIIYSKRSSPGYLIKRGLCLFILAYILNFFRYGIYAIADGIIEGQFIDETLYALTSLDIFHFAGLALMFTGLLKYFKLKSIHILIIGVILSIIGSIIAFMIQGNFVLNYLLGLFVITSEEESCFSFINWYIFVGIGMAFGEVLKKVNNKDKFYLRLLIISAIIAIIYITLSFIFGAYFLTKGRLYYATSTIEDIGYLSIDFTLLSIFYFITKNKSYEKDPFYVTMSKNVTVIYIIQWCIIGFIDSIFGYLLEIEFSYLTMYIIGIALVFIAYYLSILYNKIKEKHKLRKINNESI